MLLKCLLFVPGTLLMLRLPTIYTAFMTMANLKIYLNGPLFVIFEVCNPLLASMLKRLKVGKGEKLSVTLESHHVEHAWMGRRDA